MRVVVILGLLLVTAAAASWMVKIDIVASTRGEIVAEQRTREVRALETGVLAAIHVEEGSRVGKGGLLAELDETTVDSEIRRIEAELRDARHVVRRLRLQAKGSPAAVVESGSSEDDMSPDASAESSEPGWDTHARLAALERQRIAAALDEADRHIEAGRRRLAVIAAQRRLVERLLPVVSEQVAGLEALAARSHASRHEYLRELSRRIEMEGRAESLTAETAREEEEVARLETAARLLRLEHDALRQRDLIGADLGIARLREDLVQARRRRVRHRVAAPIDGVVQDLGKLASGSFVRQGDRLMAVVPADGRLEIRAYVRNRDVGFVAPGQAAIVKIDAFPFTRYGTAEGVVEGVSLDSIRESGPLSPTGRPNEFSAGYLARISLARPAIEIDGTVVALRPGMHAAVDIRTGRRRLLEYVIAPLVARASNALRER